MVEVMEQSLADQAYQIIEELIVTLKLPPGQVFSEAELSKKIGIGRTPLREALQRLSSDKLVKAMPRRGMIVTEINVGEHLKLLETRRVLDELMATRAARRATPDQREALRVCAGSMKEAARAGDLGAFMQYDREFDLILEAASRNSFAAHAAAPLHAHCRRFWYYYQNSSDLTQPASLHSQLMQAVSDGDEQAAATASNNLIDYLEQFTRSVLE